MFSPYGGKEAKVQHRPSFPTVPPVIGWFFDVTQYVDLAQRKRREFVHMEVDGNVQEEEEHDPFPLASHLREALSSSTFEIKMSVKRGCTYTGRCIDQIDLSVETLVFSNSDWDEEQTVVVAAVDDDIAKKCDSSCCGLDHLHIFKHG